MVPRIVPAPLGIVDIQGAFGEFGRLPASKPGRSPTRYMAAFAVANHFLFAIALFALSSVATWLMLRVRILDAPNQRSSHDQPVPNSGGVAIVLSALVGFAVVYMLSDDSRIAEKSMIGFALGAVAIVVVSIFDDLGRVRTFKLKLGIQIAAAAVLLSFDIVMRRLSLPYIGAFELGWRGYVHILLWAVGMTNIFNFMDGLNGVAGGTSVIVAAFFGILTYMQGSLFVYILCYVLFASTLGFVIFNFPRARIFMGDVGSQFLGFVFAAMAVIAAEYDASRTSMLVMPLLFFNFMFDTVFTFFRRLAAGEDVTTAHRTHLYQLFNRLGYSHTAVSLFHFAVTVLQGLGALVLIRLDAEHRAYVFLPFLAFQLIYLVVIMRAARRHEIV